jgi:small subunit ribosomal protein S1
VTHPREVVRPGQPLTLRVIRVDPEQRQIGLSLKQVASSRFMEQDLAQAHDAAGMYDDEEE